MVYFVANKQLAFWKYLRIYDLEARHGVHLGSSYLHRNAAKEFVHYITESRKQDLLSAISESKFFSQLIDGSTDQSNADNILLLALWCNQNGDDDKMHGRMS